MVLSTEQSRPLEEHTDLQVDNDQRTTAQLREAQVRCAGVITRVYQKRIKGMLCDPQNPVCSSPILQYPHVLGGPWLV